MKLIKFLSILIIYLLLYPMYSVFFSDYVLAQPVGEPVEATCDAVRNWELSWRPKIVYCSKPLEYYDNSEGIYENRYFVYSHLPDSYSNVELRFSGLPGLTPINNLTEDAAHWTGSSYISIDNSGAFYLARSLSVCNYGVRSDCWNNGCTWVGSIDLGHCEDPYYEIRFSSSDSNVLTIPIEDCTEQVIVATILFEEGRVAAVNEEEADKDFLNFGGAAFSLVFSQIKPFSMEAGSGFLSTNELIPLFLEDRPIWESLKLNIKEVYELEASIAGSKPSFYKDFGNEVDRNFFTDYLESRYKGFKLGKNLLEGEHKVNTAGEIKYDAYLSKKTDYASGAKISNGGIWTAREANNWVPYSEPENNWQREFGRYLYSESAGDYMVKKNLDLVKPWVEAIFDSIANDELPDDVILKELLSLSIEHAPGDASIQDLAITMGVTGRRVNPQTPVDLAQFRVDTILNNEKNLNKPDWAKAKVKAKLDSVKPKVGPTLDLLKEKIIQIEPLITLNDLTIQSLTLTDDIFNAVWIKDVGKLNSIKSTAISLRDSIPADNVLWVDFDTIAQMADDAIRYSNDDLTVIQLKTSLTLNGGSIRRHFSIENIKWMEQAGLIGKDLDNQGFSPTAAAKELLDDAAGASLDSTNKIAPTVQSKVSEIGSKSTGLREELHNSFKLGKSQVVGLGVGIGLTFLFSLGPKIRNYGVNYIDNFAVMVGNSIQVVGIGLSLTSAALTINAIAALSAKAAIIGWKSSLIGFGVGFIPGLIIGFLIGIVIDVIVSALWCMFWAPPGSPECGCQADPAYGEPRLKLEKRGIVKGETLNYIVYGLLYCYPPTPPDYSAALEYKDDLTSPTESGNVDNAVFDWDERISHPSDVCESVGGRCFECSVDVTNPTGGNTYYVSASYGDYEHSDYPITNMDFYHKLGQTEWSSSQWLKVCPVGYVYDESENKCVICDFTRHTENNCHYLSENECETISQCHACKDINGNFGQCCYIGEGCIRGAGGICDIDPSIKSKCEKSCGADTVCDEFFPNSDVTKSCMGDDNIPYTGFRCEKAGETHFQDKCDSSCRAVDKNNICKKPGSLCDSRSYPIDGCTADSNCNNVLNGTSWCDGNIKKSCSSTCVYSEENCNNYDGGHLDVITSLVQCSGYNYASYTSANQMRDYFCSGGDCSCTVNFDSYITQVSVNGITSGDVIVSGTEDIFVDVKVKNTGSSQQGRWYVGVEFWKVSDPNGPWETRDPNGRINTYYNAKDGTHGCDLNPDPTVEPGNCPLGVDCSIISESVNTNDLLDIGETITVRCKAPASFYGPTSGSERIMFWVHERDLGQDATNNGDTDNDGNVGDWWNDALSRIEPAEVRVEIVICPGDLNDDNKVNILDITKIAIQYGCELNGEIWMSDLGSCSQQDCPLVDFNEDNKINILDIVHVARYYGTECTETTTTTLTTTTIPTGSECSHYIDCCQTSGGPCWISATCLKGWCVCSGNSCPR